MGRPVWFVDDDPEKDKEAQDQLERIAISCGFKQVHFQYEPIAAALDYESSISGEELAVIADIGGGTSDFSIVRVSPNNHLKADRKADILANTGVHVGGTDFDKFLSLTQVMPHLGYKTPYRQKQSQELPSAPYFDLATWHRIIFLYGRKMAPFLKEMLQFAAQPELVHRLIRIVREQNGHQLAGDVEQAKIQLSSSESIEVSLPYIDEGFSIAFDSTGFENSTKELTEKISGCMHSCISDAGLLPDDINTIFLTGGTSALPFVRNACMSVVPKAHAVEGDKFGSVGIGLTIEAGIRITESQLESHLEQ